jgi:TetR/AcrR family transcriptional repressor of bet genes
LEAGYNRLDHASRQRQLIDATMQVIGQYGISGMTLQRVAEAADITAGMVNFHFKSKEALLTATLEQLVQEYAAELANATAAVTSPAAALLAIVDRHFSPPIMTVERTTLWYAFWGETHARHGYQQICAEADRFLWNLVHDQMMQLHQPEIDPVLARGMTSAFIGMIMVFVQELMLQPDESDRASAMKACLAFLTHNFPGQQFAFADGEPPIDGEAFTSAPAINESSAEWIVSTLRDIDLNLLRGLALVDICTKQRLDPKMIAILRRKFHGMSIEQVRYILALESRNQKLSNCLIDRALQTRNPVANEIAG